MIYRNDDEPVCEIFGKWESFIECMIERGEAYYKSAGSVGTGTYTFLDDVCDLIDMSDAYDKLEGIRKAKDGKELVSASNKAQVFICHEVGKLADKLFYNKK